MPLVNHSQEHIAQIYVFSALQGPSTCHGTAACTESRSSFVRPWITLCRSEAGPSRLQSFNLSSRRVVNLWSCSSTADIDHGPLSLHEGLSLKEKLWKGCTWQTVSSCKVTNSVPGEIKEVAVQEQGKLGQRGHPESSSEVKEVPGSPESWSSASWVLQSCRARNFKPLSRVSTANWSGWYLHLRRSRPWTLGKDVASRWCSNFGCKVCCLNRMQSLHPLQK